MVVHKLSGGAVNQADFKKLVKAIDIDGDGQIDYEVRKKALFRGCIMTGMCCKEFERFLLLGKTNRHRQLLIAKHQQLEQATKDLGSSPIAKLANTHAHMVEAESGMWASGLRYAANVFLQSEFIFLDRRPIETNKLNSEGKQWGHNQAHLDGDEVKRGQVPHKKKTGALNRLRSKLLAESYTKRGQDMLKLFERLDENGDGNISLDEMATGINRIVPGLMTTQQLKDLLCLM